MKDTHAYRCTHYIADGPHRCIRDATHRLLDADGWRVPGGVYCDDHASLIVDEYHEKLGWCWSMQPLDPQAARIAELEAMLKRLEWIIPGRYFDGNHCSVCDNESGWGHTDDCELGALLHKEATDD